MRRYGVGRGKYKRVRQFENPRAAAERKRIERGRPPHIAARTRTHKEKETPSQRRAREAAAVAEAALAEEPFRVVTISLMIRCRVCENDRYTEFRRAYSRRFEYRVKQDTSQHSFLSCRTRVELIEK